MDEKKLDNENIEMVKEKVPDVKVVGNGNLWKVLCKASSENEGWMKSTKSMQVSSGCLVQVTTQQRNEAGSYVIAEALAYVPYVSIVADDNGGNKLINNCNLVK